MSLPLPPAQPAAMKPDPHILAIAAVTRNAGHVSARGITICSLVHPLFSHQQRQMHGAGEALIAGSRKTRLRLAASSTIEVRPQNSPDTGCQMTYQRCRWTAGGPASWQGIRRLCCLAAGRASWRPSRRGMPSLQRCGRLAARPIRP